MQLSITNNTQAKSITGKQALLILLAGIVPFFVPLSLTAIWGLVVIITFLGFANNKIEWTWLCIAASPGLEIWARMARTPYVPNEVGKYYLVFAISLLLIHHIKRKSFKSIHNTGIIIILLLLPSLFAGLVHFDADQWIFNILGLLELAALLFIASRERWEMEFFCKILQVALIAILPVVIYITLRSPGITGIEYGLIANKQASGGYASNQVSTVIGAAITLIILLQLLHRPLLPFKWLNYLLIGYLLFRGLLTFARGGVVVAVLCAIIAFTPLIFASLRSFIRYGGIFLLFSLLSAAIFFKANDITGNKLLQRYEGETKGTLSGSREKTINTMFAGRPDIIESDFVIFADHILFGAGPGEGRKLRPAYGYKDQSAHTEFTRLLSEHGVGGLAVVILLIVFPIRWIKKQRIIPWKGIVAALFALSILTSFHSAMRTNVSIVFYALAAIPVLYYGNSKTQSQLPDEDPVPGQ